MHPSSKPSAPTTHAKNVFYRQRADAPYAPHGMPAPPSSLSPVAHASGERATATVVFLRTRRPSWRSGITIVLGGIFLGGLFGVGVHVRRDVRDDRTTTAMQPVAEPMPALQAAAPGPTALQQLPPQLPPQAYAIAPKDLPPGAVVIAPPQGVDIVAPAKPEKKSVATWRSAPPSARAPAPSHASLAPPVAKPAPPPPAPAPAKVEKPVAVGALTPSVAAAPAAEKPKPKEHTDAQKLLQDAMGETANTL